MKRRHFINSLAALLGSAVLSDTNSIFAGDLSFNEKIKTAIDDPSFWKIVKQQFNFSKDYVYLNTGGIGAVPNLVLNEVNNRMNQDQIKPSPGHNLKNWNTIKENCAALLSPDCKKEEVALVSTATEGINIIINGLPLKKNDEVITSCHEHAALFIPLLNRLQRDNIVIKTFKPDFIKGLGNVERIESLITKRTKLIFISHVTCTTGQLFPMKQIGQIARDKRIWFAVDGAQAVGSMPLDIKKNNIDFYAFSGHKWTLGPKRTGVLYVKQGLLDTLRPTTTGAYSDDGFDILKQQLKFHPTAQRYEYATQNDSLFFGLQRAVDFIKTIGLARIQTHNKILAEKFYQGLKEIPRVQVLSPEEKKYRSAIISFKIKGMEFRKIGSFLTIEKNIRVRIVPEANVNGVRVSFHVYNNENDVEKILTELKILTKKS